MSDVLIREATDEDWDAIWPFWHKIIAAGATYHWDPETDFETGRQYWMNPPPGRVFVAVAEDGAQDVAEGLDGAGRVVGTAKMSPNRGGLGDHIANASYMVDPAHSGKGIGRALVEKTIEQSRADGYDAILFNAVIETNLNAVALYQKLGFEILATVPGGFRHPEQGKVGYHIMHLKL